MSLKSKLGALIRAGSGQAMPGTSKVDLSPDTAQYTAPCDGYIVACVSTSDAGATQGYASFSSDSSAGGDFLVYSQYFSWTPRIPIRKGATMNISTGRNGFLTALQFIKSLGGGRISLALQSGGASCLRLNRLFASSQGKQVHSASSWNPALSTLPFQGKTWSTLLRKMDGFLLLVSSVRTSKRKFTLQGCKSCRQTAMAIMAVALLPLSKAWLSRSIFGAHQKLASASFILPAVAANSLSMEVAA